MSEETKFENQLCREKEYQKEYQKKYLKKNHMKKIKKR